jgi:hypothetical protein
VNLGTVEGIYIAPARGEPTEVVEYIHVIPGKGIEGDRYFYQPGTSDFKYKPDCELTLIEIEAIEALYHEDGIQITPDQTRRNIITRGVSLNNLLGSYFTIGKIQVLGIRLCEPCEYLANRTDPRVLKSMTHRGGLRAQIITDGIIHLKDKITISD